MKTKDSEETVQAFLTMITEKNDPKKFGSTKEQFAGEFKRLCKAEAMQFYSKMKETKASFAEPTKQSLKKILFLYMEHNWMQVHSQDVSICHNPEFRKKLLD